MNFNYIGIYNRRGSCRKAPLFPQDMWSQYETTLNDEDRTNNHAEAAHRRIAFELGAHHPTIWKFMGTLMKLQKGRDSGVPTTIKAKKISRRGRKNKEKKFSYTTVKDTLWNISEE